jgi:hypothetical protein
VIRPAAPVQGVPGSVNARFGNNALRQNVGGARSGGQAIPGKANAAVRFGKQQINRMALKPEERAMAQNLHRANRQRRDTEAVEKVAGEAVPERTGEQVVPAVEAAPERDAEQVVQAAPNQNSLREKARAGLQSLRERVSESAKALNDRLEEVRSGYKAMGESLAQVRAGMKALAQRAGFNQVRQKSRSGLKALRQRSGQRKINQRSGQRKINQRAGQKQIKQRAGQQRLRPRN